MDGWIKIHRKMVFWEWYKDNNVKILWLHLLLNANHKRHKWQGIEIEQGQMLTSYAHLAEQTGLTVQQVRTALNKLKSTREITIKSTSKFTLVTVENWAMYQTDEKKITSKITSKITNEQQTNNNKQECIKMYKNEDNSAAEFFLIEDLYEN